MLPQPIAPESLVVAETYLTTQSIYKTAEALSLSADQVSEYLAKPEVKNFVNTIFLNSGYRNRFKIAEAMDQIIITKLAQLSESETTSQKDIVDILALAHKMRMEELNLEAKIAANSIKTQTNIQINNDPNYASLLSRLMDSNA